MFEAVAFLFPDNKKEMLGQISHSVSMPVHPVERRYL